MLAFLGKWLKTLNAPAELELEQAAPEPFVPAPVPAEGVAVVPKGVELSKLDIMQKMWGKGFSAPGTQEFYLTLTRPLQLNAQKNMMDLSAGLGGAARLIAHEFKTYVTGFERDAALAAEGMKISTDSGRGKHATVTGYDPLNFEYSKKSDAIMACDIFYSLNNKNMMLENMSKWLKPRGQLVMTDFVCDAETLKQPVVELWQTKELYGAHPISNEVMLKLLAKHGFDVRITEDMTVPYAREVLLGLARLTQWLEGQRLSRASKVLVGQTVDLWATRLGALDKGVKNMRYHAIKTT